MIFDLDYLRLHQKLKSSIVDLTSLFIQERVICGFTKLNAHAKQDSDLDSLYEEVQKQRLISSEDCRILSRIVIMLDQV
jgi:hypothetical protein